MSTKKQNDIFMFPKLFLTRIVVYLHNILFSIQIMFNIFGSYLKEVKPIRYNVTAPTPYLRHIEVTFLFGVATIDISIPLCGLKVKFESINK